MKKDSKNVAKVLICNDNKYLILTRTDNGKLDLPGGHVHVDEEYLMGAAREVYEECKIILLSCKEIMSYGKKKLFFSDKFSYLNKSNSIELDLKENKEYNWVTEEDFLKIKISNATDALVAAQSHLMSESRK